MNSADNSLKNEAARQGAAEGSGPRHRELSSDAIFAGEKTVTIVHDGIEYRLQITRNNKLILQK